MSTTIDLAGATLTIVDVESSLQRHWEQTGHSAGFLLTCSRSTHRIVSSFGEDRQRICPLLLINTHFGPLTIFASERMPNNRIAIYENVQDGPIAVLANFDTNPMSYPWL